MLSIPLQKAVLRVFANVAIFSENRRCRIFTRSTCSKENLISQFFKKRVHFQSLSQVDRNENEQFLSPQLEYFEFLLEVDLNKM